MLAKELSIDVDRRPYLLRPERPPEGEERRLFDGETQTELNPEMQERARGVGLVMHRPQWSPNTLRPRAETENSIIRPLRLTGDQALTSTTWTF